MYIGLCQKPESITENRISRFIFLTIRKIGIEIIHHFVNKTLIYIGITLSYLEYLAPTDNFQIILSHIFIFSELGLVMSIYRKVSTNLIVNIHQWLHFAQIFLFFSREVILP